MDRDTHGIACTAEHQRETPATKIDADHFSAHIDDFIPKKELNVSFITSDDWFKDGKP